MNTHRTDLSIDNLQKAFSTAFRWVASAPPPGSRRRPPDTKRSDPPSAQRFATEPKPTRPGLDQAVAAVRAGDTLVVPKPERLAGSVPDARALADHLEKKGVRLALGASVHDPADPTGNMFFNILVTFAEFEADLSFRWPRHPIDARVLEAMRGIVTVPRGSVAEPGKFAPIHSVLPLPACN